MAAPVPPPSVFRALPGSSGLSSRLTSLLAAAPPPRIFCGVCSSLASAQTCPRVRKALLPAAFCSQTVRVQTLLCQFQGTSPLSADVTSLDPSALICTMIANTSTHLRGWG